MKQLSIIFLFCIYALSSFGFGFKGFYCCGKLKSVSLAFSKESKGNCVKGDDTGNCCKTIYTFNTAKDNHIASEAITLNNNFLTELFATAHFYEAIQMVRQRIKVINGSHAPPLYSNVPLYLSNSVFRI